MSTNPQRGEVEVILDKPRIMVINFKAMAQAETIGNFKMFGLNVSDIGVNEFRALGYAGLLKHNPRLTLDQFDDLIDTQERFMALQHAVLAAIARAFPEAKPADDTENPQTPAASPAPGQAS
jgi:hypothetical protein